MRPLVLILAMLAMGSGRSLAQTFATNFDGTENPLSEGGEWSHDGRDWTQVQKVDGLAYGTQTGSGGYDDSYAYLSGFAADQTASGVIHRTPGGSGIHEVEILLRWSDSSHSATGYECLLSYDASYAQIVRWNGPFGDFTYIGWAAHAPLPQTGDTFSAAILDSLIIAYYNGVEIMRATDSSYPTGDPGVGFYVQSTGSNGEFGFTSYMASGTGASEVEMRRRTGRSPHARLSQNRPNPFCGSTELEYELLRPGPVSLRVYDVLGREVAALANESKPAGRHAAWFDGATLKSGVYVVRLRAGDRVETRKMLLVR